MRIGRVQGSQGPTWAIVEGDTVYALDGNPYENPRRGARIGDLSAAKLLAPCEPTKLVCIGRNYKAHIEETNAPTPKEPLMFFKPPTSVVGPGDDVVWAPGSEKIDYEAELVVVFKKRAKNVPAGGYKDYVLGYTCGNDISARDFQDNDDQWSRAKGSDTFCPLGPWIETGVDPNDLRITGKLDGKVVQDARTSDLLFKIDYLIEFMTRYFTMLPGDAIMTGTPSGIGRMPVGSAYEVTIEGIGSLTNRMTK